MQNELDTAAQTRGANMKVEPELEELSGESTPAVQLDPKPESKAPEQTSSGIPEISKYSKLCTLCQTPRDVLIRCQIDDTKRWHFICTGKCWKSVSGGVVDGDGSNKWYKYGGMWKNKHEAVSARIKGKAKNRNRGEKGRKVVEVSDASRKEHEGENEE